MNAMPAITKAGGSTWIENVRTRLGYFMVHRPDESSGSGDSPLLVGKDAAEALMVNIQATYDKDPSKVTYAEVAKLKCFGWLLETSSLQMLQQIGSKLVAERGADVKPAVKLRKGVSREEAQERLSNLFKR